jgi:hypothetical protein
MKFLAIEKDIPNTNWENSERTRLDFFLTHSSHRNWIRIIIFRPQ